MHNLHDAIPDKVGLLVGGQGLGLHTCVHAGEHEAGAHASVGAEADVRVQPIAHHQDFAGLQAVALQQLPDDFRRRLAHNLRRTAARGLERRDQRPSFRHEVASGVAVPHVWVRADEGTSLASSLQHPGGNGQLGIGEGLIVADDHGPYRGQRLDRSSELGLIKLGGQRRVDHSDPSKPHLFPQALSADDKGRLDALCRGHCGRHAA
mmetsp:Transcript_49134/g.151762  ORF Transcript_49134/g.151762 Transcript_49134/m.151762 type:complete len:207 (-) Transcript_49134:121-741(-)